MSVDPAEPPGRTSPDAPADRPGREAAGPERAARTEAEEAAQASEQRFRFLFRSMREGYAHCRMRYEDGAPRDFLYLEVNDRFLELTGLRGVVGRWVSEAVPGLRAANPEVFEVYGRVALTGVPERLETFVKPLGKWLSISAYSPEREHFVAVFADIDDRKRAEAALEKAAAEIEDLYENAPCGYHSLGPDGTVLRINATELSWLGYAREEIVGRRKVSDLMTPESAERFRAEFPGFLERGWVRDLLFDLVRKDGTLLPVIASATAVRDADGRLVMSRSTLFEDVLRREAVRELRESERVARARAAEVEALMEALPVATMIGEDPQCRRIVGNRTSEQLLRVAPGANLSRSADEAERPATFRVRRDGRELAPDELPMQRAAASGRPQRGVAFTLDFGGGDERQLIGDAVPLLDDAGAVRGAVGAFVDVTDRHRAEAAARRQAELLAIAEKAAGAGVWHWDIVSGVLSWTPEFYRLFRLDPDRDEATFETWRSRVHPDDLEAAERRIQDAVARHEPLENDYRIVVPGGGVRWIKALGTAEYAPSGQPIRMAGICLDVTERRRQEEVQRERDAVFRQVFENSVIGKSITAVSGELQVNQALADMLGYSREELAGKRWSDVTHPDDVEASARELELLLSGRKASARVVKRFVRRDGAVVWVDLHTALMRDAGGKPLCYVTAMADITDRVRAEDEVRRLNADLERRVSDRTAELVEALREMEGLSYSVAHDLRAPIRAIHGFASLLAEGYGDRLDEEGRHLLGTIEKAARQGGHLIDDLLRFSRLGRTPLETRRVDMAALVEELRAELASTAEGRRVELRVGPLPEAEGDPRLLRVVWANLLSNGVKFSGGRAAPVVEVGARTGPDGAEYFVRDNGVGFDMSYAGKLFGVFQRLHGLEEFPGTGIGLALVRRIVERHGGRVRAEGEVDGGATFRFSLGHPAAGEPDGPAEGALRRNGGRAEGWR